MGVQQGKDEVRTMDKYVGNQPHNQYHHRKYAVVVRPYGDIKFSYPYSPQGRGYQTHPGRSIILLTMIFMATWKNYFNTFLLDSFQLLEYHILGEEGG